jgi:hypothetical protein
VAPQPSSPEPASPVEPPEAATFEAFDPGNFGVDSAKLTHRFFPLTPGTRFTWEGSTQEGDEPVPHRVVFTVTDLTKVVDGVRTLVGWDRDFSAGQLIEGEIIFYAQDKAGTIWHLGQLREMYEENGEFAGGRGWLQGLEGSKAGIVISAEPQAGTPSYSMGWAPAPFYWDDRARVDKLGEKTCVPAGCYEDVLVIDEFELDNQTAHQLKYYAPGVGEVRVGYRGTDAEKETLELVKVEQLDAAGLAEARAAALAIENRAYTWGRTQPVAPAPAAR